ncbi:ribonuclease Z [Aquipuribacter hungaricus]|uniref:Ribonuclease Z n=1 Tax=Aquipuribacter hungaricus TaxID=545624 RepID=A0ABV7WI59_9MICO
MVRELVVLGTASQVPTRARNHNGYLLRWDGEGVLVDPGEGTQRQMTYADVSASSVTRVCLTHLHGDHCLGLPGVVQRMALDGVAREVPVHFPAGGEAHVAALLASSAHVETLQVRPAPVPPTPAPGVVVADGAAWTLTAVALDHRVPTVGYRLQEADGVRMLPERLAALSVAGPDVGRLQREGVVEMGGRRVALDEVSEPRPGQSVAVVMDTRACDGALALARGVDLLVCESTFLDADRDLAERYGHLTARQAGELAARAGARRLVLTHFSQRYGDSGEPFLAEAQQVHDDVVAAEDGMRVAVPRRR